MPMRKRYKRILYFIGLLLVGCIGLGIAYICYDHVLGPETEVEVVGELSINYIDGKIIDTNKTYNFSVTNNGTNDIYYEILIDNLKNYESQVNYSLSSSEASLNIKNNPIDNNASTLASNILISEGATQNFKITLNNNKMTSFNLKIKKTIDSKEYFYMTLIKNNPVNDETLTKVGEELATGYEGLIKDIDDLGTTYYFRGNVTDNYVLFADNLWRIVRINGDGTVKLILNKATPELTSYHISLENSEDFANTSIVSSLNTYYETYLQAYDDYIAAYKFCVDNLNNGETNKIYNAYNRIAVDKIPTFNCLGSTYNSKIGLLSADEALYAGANTNDDNKKYYLYNSDIENVWWTATLAKATTDDFNPFVISASGRLLSNVSGLLNRNLRPTINLNRKVLVTGDGTIDNPYLPYIE